MLNRNEQMTSTTDLENERETLTVHWRAVIAGVFISILTYLTMTSLGVAIGAHEMKDVISGENSLKSLGAFAVIWLGGAVLISLYLGSYASSRVSGIIATRVGYIQGAVISSVFFVLMLTQFGLAVDFLGAGLSRLGSGVAQSTSGLVRLAQDSPLASQFTSVIEDALSDLDVGDNVEVVTRGLLVRVLRGDTESAINYFSAQTGISREEARQRMNTLRTDIGAQAAAFAQSTARTTRSAGWTAFAIMVFGTICSMLGGAVGAQFNLRKPLSDLDRKAIRHQHRVAYNT